MTKAIGYTLLFIGGAMLGYCEIYVNDWRFWAIVVPLGLGSALT